ncbi:MAG: histidine phosphatase family protein [Candidatus Paceibacterota bacterium]
MKNIYFVRHGESEGNQARLYQSSGTSLSETGHNQAKLIADRFYNIEVETIVTSNYIRAKQTTGYIAEVTGKDIIENQLFRERKRPSIQENQSKENPELIAIDKQIEDNWGNLDWKHSDEENFADLRQRAKECFEYLENMTEDNIVVVTHKNFLHCLLWYCLFGYDVTARDSKTIVNNFIMSNTGIVWMQYDEIYKFWKVVTWNDHSHLG